MTAARDALIAASAQVVVRRPDGVAGLLAGLHRDPATAGLPIESVALPPVPRSTDPGSDLVALLVVPDGTDRVHRPFAMVTWDPVTSGVRDLHDWGTRPPDAASATAPTWPAPAGEQPLRTVCTMLDQWVGGNVPDGADLRRAYRVALSDEARSWYIALEPGCTPWLSDLTETPEGAAAPAGPVPDGDGDLGAGLGRWIRDASALAGELGAAELTSRIDDLTAQRRRPGFRLTVVGEFNRGKSTLVNRLLGTEVLETGPVPTTTTFSILRPGREASENAEGSHRTFVVPCDWLAEADTELVDTPGTNESGDDRTADVRRAVTLSDGVFLVVSAASPFTRTERELLEQEVLRRRVPFVAVVVSFLDDLEISERTIALERIHATVERLAHGVPVLLGPGTTGGEDELAALRSTVRDFAMRNGDRRWRSIKIGTAIADVAADIADIAIKAAATAAMDDEHRTEAVRRERAEVDRDAGVWDDIRVELDTRRRRLAERVHAALAADAQVIMEALHHELLRVPDPKEYWERDAAYRLRRELGALTRKCESVVVAGMATDLDDVDRTLAERFGTTDRSSRPAPGLVAPDPVLPDAGVTDLTRRKLLTRVGATGGTIAGYALGAAAGLAMPPIAIGLGGSLVAALLAERSVRTATHQQREVVDRLLGQVVADAVMEVTEGVSDRLRAVYAEVGTELGARRAAWRHERLRALRTPPAAAEPLYDLAARATRLSETVRAAVAAETTAQPEEL